jgi:hypothetical protein
VDIFNTFLPDSLINVENKARFHLRLQVKLSSHCSDCKTHRSAPWHDVEKSCIEFHTNRPRNVARTNTSTSPFMPLRKSRPPPGWFPKTLLFLRLCIPSCLRLRRNVGCSCLQKLPLTSDIYIYIHTHTHIQVKLSLDRAFRLQEVEGRRIIRQSEHKCRKVVSRTYRPPLPPGDIPGTHFCYRLSRPQGHSATGRVKSMKNSNDTIGNRTRSLPVCSAVP